jgi:competence ComEA-like helix-hairpin-helix protein
MFERVKSYFIHYRSERRGIIVLLIIIFLSIVGVELFRYFYEPTVERIDVLIVNENHPDKSFNNPTTTSEKKEIQLFRFNPNTLNDSGYAKLGFSEKEIKTLRNYQKAGGHFEIKRDFSKLFFVDEEEYLALEEYIDLPQEKAKSNWNYSYASTGIDSPEHKINWSDTADTKGYSYTTFTCNINTADTNELKRLRGIGSFYANKIIEYREELGGYHSLAQLMELWEMTPDKIDKFADQVSINTEDIRRININKASAHELSQHPYLSFGQSNKIVLKREELGKFSDSRSFCSEGLLDADLCRKLVPYLKFSE